MPPGASLLMGWMVKVVGAATAPAGTVTVRRASSEVIEPPVASMSLLEPFPTALPTEVTAGIGLLVQVTETLVTFALATVPDALPSVQVCAGALGWVLTVTE